ncbi:MAG: hypothetical protein U0441_00860 [Polyangiaceae bacterium]
MKKPTTMLFSVALILGALAGAPLGCSTEILPPTAAASADATTVAVGGTVLLDGSKSTDPQELILYYKWTLVEAPKGSHAALSSDSTAKASFVADVPGDYTVGLVVSNGTLTSEMVTAKISTNTCGTNLPVVGAIAANPALAAMNQPVSLTADVTDADMEDPCKIARVITKSWKLAKVPPGSLSAVSDSAVDAPFFVPDMPGDYTVSLTATDELGRSGNGQLVVTVNDCSGNAPVITSVTPSADNPVVGQTVNFASAVTDKDTDAACGLTESFSYEWTLVAQPAGSLVTLNNKVAEAPSLTPDLEGEYTVSLVVTDLAGHKSEPSKSTITATTCGGAKPTASIEELVPDVVAAGGAIQGPDVGTKRTVQITAKSSSDPDNAAPCNLSQGLTYQWTMLALPAGSSATLNDATIVNPSFFTDYPGDYMVGLVVTDETGKKSDQATFKIHADPSIGISVPAGFTITTVATWPDIDSPRGLTKDPAGNIYVVNGADASIYKVATDSKVSVLSKGGFMTAPLDVAYDASTSLLFVTGGGGNITKVDLAGVQSACVDNGAASFRGVDVYNGTGGLRLMAADQFGNRAYFYDPATCTQQSTNNFGASGLDNPWGVTASVMGGVDNAFLTDSSADIVKRNQGGAYSNDGGTNVTISSSNVLSNPRDVVVTPCPTPKLIVANHDNADVLLIANAAGSTPTVIATNFGTPLGLYFEDANNLLVTDEVRDTVHRITGNFCGL